ncbi:tetratricopeptide repeat protein, partial [Planomonospora sp. ID91781]|uniref:FxSxx-COOH system tetratricopeptide repeat protein n=1 Tax=Planomonospora sp. ID91781 TaxID=2738135 RepID=UPI0018C41885
MQATASGQARVNQAGRDQTIVQQQTVLPAEALRSVAQVDAPPRLVNLPALSLLFVGRGDELAELEQALAGAGPVVVAAVHGLGGIGKSTLAARYAAASHTGGLNPVWWITADSPASIEAGLAALAVALQPELATVLPQEGLAQRAVAWLACHHGWLLVLDNVTHPGHLTDLLGRVPDGRVLVTSRLGEGWHRVGAVVLRLDVLSQEQSIALLTRIATAGWPGADLDGAAELVDELGCLPLAIEQAGAYLRQNRLSPRAYLDLLAAHPAVMYDQAAEGGDAERTIAQIWRLTLDRLTDTPLAGDLLRILAWYAPEALPRDVLDGVESAPLVQQALGRLAAYNMINIDGAGITVHRLVQAVARTGNPDDPHRSPAAITAARARAVDLLARAHPAEPDDPAFWPRWRALLPHLDAMFARMPAETDTADAYGLLLAAGRYLQGQGALGHAVRYLERCVALAHRVYDPDHPAVLVSQSNLANAYQAAGDLNRAVPLLEQTLTDQQRVLGDDHPTTLTSRNNLASAYQAAGNLNRAVPLLEQTLTDRQRVLGDDHPDTLNSRNNLAS